MLQSLYRKLSCSKSSTPSRSIRQSRRDFRPRIEQLEDRSLPSTLVISPATLPGWDLSQPGYKQTIEVSGGTGMTTFALASGALPPGLTFDSQTGVINGKPTKLVTNDFTIDATDSVGDSVSKLYVLSINSHPAIETKSLPSWTENVAFNQDLSVQGGATPYNFVRSSGSLPTGLAIDPTTGAIGGKPATAGTFHFTIQLTDGAKEVTTKSYAFTIHPSLTITANALSNWTVYQSNYKQLITVAGGTGSHTFAVTSGTLPTGLTLDTNTGLVTGEPATPGSSTFTVTAMDSLGSISSKTYTVTINSPPIITTTSLPTWTAELNYNQTIEVSDGTANYLFAVTANKLPPGMALNINTGAITGKPNLAGTYHFTISVTDASKVSFDQAYTLKINPALTFTTKSLPIAKVNLGYTQTVQASGGTGTLTFSLDIYEMPPGFIVFYNEDKLWSPPGDAVPGSYHIKMTFTDSLGASVSKVFSLIVEK